jgi:hypothetical protein
MTRKKILLLVKCVKEFRFAVCRLPQCVQSLRKVQIEIQKRVSKRKMANLHAGFKFIDADYYKKVTIKKLQEKILANFHVFHVSAHFFKFFFTNNFFTPCIQHLGSRRKLN